MNNCTTGSELSDTGSTEGVLTFSFIAFVFILFNQSISMLFEGLFDPKLSILTQRHKEHHHMFSFVVNNGFYQPF